MATPLLEVENLQVHFETEDGLVKAVDGISYTVERGQTLGIVGESGSGKSVSSMTVMGLTRARNARITGTVRFDGKDLLGASEDDMRAIRGNDIAMIFQDPLSSLHPFYTIEKQLVEAVQVHQSVGKGEARKQAIALLERVGIPNPDRRIDDYPHQLSGGMRQRVMIAMALVNSPALLIADEPTTALDVTVQAQILELISSLQEEFGITVIMITHDLGVVADMADEVVVMYGGRLVEHGTVNDIFHRPEMPYTLGLLASMPRLDKVRADRLDPIPGLPPSLIRLPKGCVFRPRCTYHDRVPDGLCDTVRPDLLPTGPGHEVRCHMPPEERRAIAAERLGARYEETA